MTKFAQSLNLCGFFIRFRNWVLITIINLVSKWKLKLKSNVFLRKFPKLFVKLIEKCICRYITKFLLQNKMNFFSDIPIEREQEGFEYACCDRS